jgi:hypothetical protein
MHLQFTLSDSKAGMRKKSKEKGTKLLSAGIYTVQHKA